MKHSILILLTLSFAACGSDEPQTTAGEAQPQVDEAPVVDLESEASDETTDTVDTPLQVVEESAAEEVVETDDKPIMLAQATETETTERDWQFSEGTHYVRMVPSQPTWGGADKIEVAEFFWYGCPHCFDFEPYLGRWKQAKDPNVRFVKVPAMWNAVLELHGRMFYTEEALGRSGKIQDPEAFRNMVFSEYHRRGNRLTSVNSIFKLFERVGVSREDFDSAWNSFEVDQNMRKAKDLARRYSIASVPMVVVNGKYRTDGATAGSYNNLIGVIDELTAREGLK